MTLYSISASNVVDDFIKYAAANKIGTESLMTGSTICLLSLVEELLDNDDMESQLYATELMDVYLQLVEIRLQMRQKTKSGGLKVVK